MTASKQPGQEGLVEPATLATLAALGLLLGSLARQELLLLAVDDVLAGVEIGLVGLDATGLVVELVAEDEDDVKRNAEVASDESLVLLLAEVSAGEDIVVLGEGDDDAEEQSAIGAPDTKRCDVRQDLVGDVLRLAGLAPPDVSDEDRDPGEQTEDGRQVDEVAEDSLGVVGDVHEGQQGKEGGESKSVDGDTALVSTLEDGGSGAVGCQTIEGTAGNVQIRVGCRKDKDADAGVDDVGDDLDTSELGSDHEGRGGGAGLGLVGESEVVGVHANEKDTQAVEEQDTVEGQLDRTGNGLAGVLGLGDGDTNKLSAQVGEGGVDHAGPETEEAASVASVDVFPEGTGRMLVGVHNSFEGCKEVIPRVLPVTEALAVVVRTAAKSQDEREEDDANDGDDLETGKPELEFAEELDTEVVDCNNDDQEDGDEDTRVHGFAIHPELNDEGGGCKLVGRDDDILEPITARWMVVSACAGEAMLEGNHCDLRPAKRETKRGIAESRGVAGETRRDGKPRGHLTETSHDEEDDETDESVRDED
ncbi:hypothetical protein ColTof4_12728 [Colletotrichum tofieldiae]|nr:hypothetical protein ColTof3_14439 [Colletotrichum tofieldiae]GKT80305.1 hypothetical protein ColTof4_12728 [Colletotrichum tofieldiae]